MLSVLGRSVSNSIPLLGSKQLIELRKAAKLAVLKCSYVCALSQVMAILGASGSGKTSLLNVIAQRAAGSVHGTVRVNNYLLTRALATKHVGYVLQDDHLLPRLTGCSEKL